jgi:predicted nucleic acid-binding protein
MGRRATRLTERGSPSAWPASGAAVKIWGRARRTCGAFEKRNVEGGWGLADILLDSDVIIAWLRGCDPYSRAIPDLLRAGDVLLWTPVSVAEIFSGARKSELERISDLSLILSCLPVTADTGKQAGEYLQRYTKSHGVELGDALIAASAALHDIPLWTLNRKHYPMKNVRFFVLAR